MEVRITTSLYGLNELSYTRATIVITKRYTLAKGCKSNTTITLIPISF